MILHFCASAYPCAKAVKDEAAGTVRAFNERDIHIFHASGVTDFSLFSLEGGDWADAGLDGTTQTQLALAELAETQARHDLENKLAIAELAEAWVGGVRND